MLPMPFTASDGAVGYAIARRLRALDVLQRADDVEEAHRQDDREVGEQMARRSRPARRSPSDGHRQVQPGADRRRLRPARCPSATRAAVPTATATSPPGRPPRKRTRPKYVTSTIAERRQPDDRPREGAEEEAERDEAERDAGQRRQQRGARRRRGGPRSATGASDQLDQAGAEARDQPSLPGDARPDRRRRRPRRRASPAA